MKENHRRNKKAEISPELVAKAKTGDQAAFAELYQQTSTELYRSIRAMVHDEDTAWDIQQDTYLRAYQGLSKLAQNEAFLPWLRRIAVNVTASRMRKRLPIPFTELGSEDDEQFDQPDLRIDTQPELALDRQETSRLVREILAALPEEQHLILGMRYYEELSVKEIADLLKIAPSTVRNQLSRGCKRVETAVRDLEQKGIKLYGLSPLAFLGALLRRVEPTDSAAQAAMQAVMTKTAGSAVGMTATQVSAPTLGQMILHGLVGKILVGALSLAVIGGCIWTGARLLREGSQDTPYRPSETSAVILLDQEQGTEDLTASFVSDTQDTTEPVDATETEDTTDAAEAAEPQTEATEESGEPEGWEEEWPEEYPIESYRLLDGAITQTGRLNKYRYAQLEGAENYMNLLADYVREALDCGDALTMREDSPHDGYANWFMDAPNGSAAVSGSSITGRFTFDLYPGFSRVLEMTEREISDRDDLRQAAMDFAARVSGITGSLKMIDCKDDLMYYHDERRSGLHDVAVPVMVYTFRSPTESTPSLELQEGVTAPIVCGDSTVEDLHVHVLNVTVWPDGTVVRSNNYITRAEPVQDGSVRMPDESDVPELLTYLTSYTEHDTIVIEKIRAESFGVYFGNATVHPILTVTYYFESKPTEHQTTEYSMELFDED